MRKMNPGLNPRNQDISPRDADGLQKGIVYKNTKEPGSKELVPQIINETIYSMMNIKEGKTNNALIGIINQEQLLVDDVNDITEGGTYISDELNMPIPGILVYSSREDMYRRLTSDNLFDKQFTEIDFEEDSDQMVPPTINDKLGQDGIQARNGKWLSKQRSDIAKRLGEEVIYQIEANHHLLLFVEAWNYLIEDPEGKDADGIPDREGLKYEWRFSSGEDNYDVSVIEKVVSTKPLLSIEDAQRSNIGRYTCHVSNNYGKVKTWTCYVDVNRPGEVKEQVLTLSNGEEVLTGQYTWIANDNSSQHDELFSQYDDKFLYDPLGEVSYWIKCYWDETANWWKEETTNKSFIFDNDLYPQDNDQVWEDEGN